jgi:hypothetical protein
MTPLPSRARKRPRAMRTTVLRAAAAIALGFAGQNLTALAQQSDGPLRSAPGPETDVWPAPVGHRQPTRTDLPPGLRRDEGAITPGERNFDSSLNICRGC